MPEKITRIGEEGSSLTSRSPHDIMRQCRVARPSWHIDAKACCGKPGLAGSGPTASAGYLQMRTEFPIDFNTGRTHGEKIVITQVKLPASKRALAAASIIRAAAFDVQNAYAPDDFSIWMRIMNLSRGGTGRDLFLRT